MTSNSRTGTCAYGTSRLRLAPVTRRITPNTLYRDQLGSILRPTEADGLRAERAT